MKSLPGILRFSLSFLALSVVVVVFYGKIKRNNTHKKTIETRQKISSKNANKRRVVKKKGGVKEKETVKHAIENQKYRVSKFSVDVSNYGKVFRENCYLLFDKNSRDAVIIDPGNESPELESFIQSKNLTIHAILNTHGHFDHIGANDFYRKKYGVKVYGHPKDRHKYKGRLHRQLPDIPVKGEVFLQFGSLKIRTIHIPGHSMGSIALLAGEHLFSGDSLFRGSVGKTWGDSLSKSRKMRSQTSNIKVKILTLPGSTHIYPGHGPSTSVRYEKLNNPYLK